MEDEWERKKKMVYIFSLNYCFENFYSWLNWLEWMNFSVFIQGPSNSDKVKAELIFKNSFDNINM